MKKLFLLLTILFLTISSYPQSLVQTVPLPAGAYWNSAYGMVYALDKYWISSGSSTTGKGKFYGLNANGQVLDSIIINYPTISYSQGLAFDGTNFWYVGAKGARYDLYKVSPAGVVLDSIPSNTLSGTSAGFYIGGAAWDGDGLWFSVYSPNARAKLFKVNTTTKTLVDSCEIFGTQPQGVTVKGDTLFYVMDAFEGDPEKIYALDISTKDTLFSWHLPNPVGTRQYPRGLAWDGEYFWLLASPVGGGLNNRVLFKYDLEGGGSPSIQILTPTINFGNIQVDSTVTAEIYIKNYGAVNLIITSAITAVNVFNVLETFPIIIKPDSTKSLTVAFTPAAYQQYSDSVKIYHNDPNFTYSKVFVSGHGVYTAPYAGLSQTSLAYGERRLNSTSSKEIKITNFGSAILNIDSLALETGQYYYLENDSTPVSLNLNESTSFTVWFNPEQLITYSDNIKIFSNASNGNVMTIPLSGTGANLNPALGTIIWEANIPDNPNTLSDDFQIDAIAIIQDINEDGVEDIIACSENYWIIAYSGNSSVDGNILWKFNTYGSNNDAGSVDYQQALYIVSDVNQDGHQDIIAGTGGGGESVFAIDGKTGLEIWEVGDPTNYDQGDIMAVDASRDWNGDGVPDVVATASGNESNGNGRFSVYCFDGRTGAELWRIDQSAQQKLKYQVAVVENGAAAGSRVGSSYEVIGIGNTGTLIWAFPTSGTPWALNSIQNLGGDSNRDYIAGTTSGNVYTITSDAGTQIWQTNIGNVFIEDIYIVPDVNGNGYDDILISGISPNVFMLEGLNGSVIWQQYTGGNIVGKGVLGDMNGDAIPEVAAAPYNYATMYIYNGKTGNEVFNYVWGPSGNYTAEQIIRMPELYGGGAGEFVAGSRNGRLIAFSGGPDGIVPVEFETFSASVSGTNVLLSWSTASEINNHGFSVERKKTDGEFAAVTFIEGRGTTTEKNNYFYEDAELSYGEYTYRLKQIDLDGTFTYSPEVEVSVGLPIVYSLEQNYPNPFNPATIIKYSLPYDGFVNLSIYNSLGEKVQSLVNEVNKAGNYTINFNASSLASGVYIYRIESGKFISSKKMMLLK